MQNDYIFIRHGRGIVPAVCLACWRRQPEPNKSKIVVSKVIRFLQSSTDHCLETATPSRVNGELMVVSRKLTRPFDADVAGDGVR